MKLTSTVLAVVITVALASFVVLYALSETPRIATSPSAGEQQKEMAKLKQQVAGLEDRVHWLEERFTEPQRNKPTQF
jgi:cytochrome c-type biogenesis protein CcmE